MPAITDDVLLTISGTIEKMLLEQQEGIDFAYQKIPDGIKISIGVNLDPTSQGIRIQGDGLSGKKKKPPPVHDEGEIRSIFVRDLFHRLRS